jgi:myosin heavy subunit
VMTFLTFANSTCTHSAEGFGDRIKKIILESSLLFESFGNAKTVRNDNSSRFGKYIKLQYEGNENKLVSAHTETFLLEKSRLVSVGKGERNYHVFYQLIRGLKQSSPGLAASLKLHSVDMFSILTEGGCTLVTDEEDDVRDFQVLQQALETLGCTTEEITHIWSICACVLHLGNMNCESGGSDNIPCTLTPKSAELGMSIKEIAKILGADCQLLIKGITEVRLQAAKRSSVNTKILSATDAKNNIYALVKWLYKRMFDWIVRKVNHSHHSVADDFNSSKSHAAQVSSKFIGILDIFGFEILGVNSFEQLCINYTNERLQQQFNEHVFVLEQQEYAREGLDWKSISYRDNQHVIDLISKKPTGLLIILEEHGMMNRKPDDVALLNSFNQTHDKVQTAYQKSRFGNDRFIVKHFAGDVTYTVDGFLVKNNDSLQDGLSEVIYMSDSVFLTNMLIAEDGSVPLVLKPGPGFVPLRDENGEPVETNLTGQTAAGAVDNKRASKKMAATQTVSFSFRGQLDKLMSTLRSTHPHYIKCIKPNALKAPNVFTAPLVMEQLRYSGVLEVVRIRREGFPTKVPFIDFYTQYTILAHGKGWESPETVSAANAKNYCSILLSENMPRGSYQVGNSFVFLGHDAHGRLLEAINAFFMRRARTIQARVRRNQAVKDYANTRRLLVIVATFVRMSVFRARFKKIRRQVMGIQKLYKIILFKRCLSDKNRRRVQQRRHDSAIIIQKHARRMRAERKVSVYRKRIYLVQLALSKFFRRRKSRRMFLLSLKRVLMVQCLIRRYLGRVSYRKSRGQVVCLQSLWRRARATRLLQKARRCMVLLQAWVRSKVAKKMFRRRIARLVALQARIRRFLCLLKYRRMCRRLIQLQACWRRHGQTATFQRTRKAINCVQSWYRSRKQLHAYQKQKQSAIQIQTCVRRHSAVTRYRRMKISALRLHAMIRMFVRRHRHKRIVRAINRLQFCIRRFTARKQSTTRKENAALRLQTAYRCCRGRRQFAHKLACLVALQARMRMFIPRKRFVIQQFAAICLQSKYRSFVAQRNYQAQQVAVLTLQSFGRMVHHRRAYEEKQFFLLLIQTCVRRYLARTKYLAALHAVTMIQAHVRRWFAVWDYNYVRACATKIASAGRMYICKRQYETTMFSLLLIQNQMRRCIYETRYFIARYSILKLQTIVRAFLCRNTFLKKVDAAVKLQAIARMNRERDHYQLTKFSILSVQTTFRRHKQQARYQLARFAIILMQSLARKLIARSHFLHAKRCAIKVQTRVRVALATFHYRYDRLCVILIQTRIRGLLSRLHFMTAKWAATTMQSTVRMYQARLNYLWSVWAAIRVSGLIRRFNATRQVDRLRRATHRIYVCVQAYVRNRGLRERAFGLHAACAGGAVDYVQQLFADYPEDQDLHLKWANFQSLRHSAVIGAQCTLITQVLGGLNVSNMLAKDGCGNGLLHALGQWPNYSVLMQLVRVCNAVNTVVSYEVKDEDENEEDNDTEAPLTPGGPNNVTAGRLTDAVSGLPILMAGWMSKKRNNAMMGFKKWNRRWCVLTEETLTYYKTDAKGAKPCGFLPLEGCVIERPNGKEAIITVVSPQTVFKKGMFGDKMVGPLVLSVESERDLQGWLNPLKSAAGVTPFRTPMSVNFINCELRDSWFKRTNKYGDTVLHVLARAAQHWRHSTPVAAASANYISKNTAAEKVREKMNKFYGVCRRLYNYDYDFNHIEANYDIASSSPVHAEGDRFESEVASMSEQEGLRVTCWLLCACPALLDMVNNYRETPLQIAISSRNAALIVLFHRRGADDCMLNDAEAEQLEYANMAINHGESEPSELYEIFGPKTGNTPANSPVKTQPTSSPKKQGSSGRAAPRQSIMSGLVLMRPMPAPPKAKGYSFIQLHLRRLYSHGGDK